MGARMEREFISVSGTTTTTTSSSTPPNAMAVVRIVLSKLAEDVVISPSTMSDSALTCSSSTATWSLAFCSCLSAALAVS